MLDSITQLLSSGFFVTLAGVVVGGAIAAASTMYFERRRELSQRRGVAIQLAYRIVLLTSELGDIRNQIRGSIEAAKGKGVPESNYWAEVQSLIGTPSEVIEIHADELGWMHRKEDIALAMDIIQFVRKYNLTIALMSRYNNSREELEIATAEHANFRITHEGVVAEIGFDIRAHPNLVRMIGTTNNLLLELATTLDEANQKVTGILERLNVAMPKYFPRHYFKYKLQLVDEGAQANVPPVPTNASPTSQG